MRRRGKHRQLDHPRGHGRGRSEDGFGNFRRPWPGKAVMPQKDGVAEIRPPDVHPDGTDLRPYKRLAAAVIRQALLDAQYHGNTEARRWLSEDSDSLRFWCQWLGINLDQVHGTGREIPRRSRKRGTIRAWAS